MSIPLSYSEQRLPAVDPKTSERGVGGTVKIWGCQCCLEALMGDQLVYEAHLSYIVLTKYFNVFGKWIIHVNICEDTSLNLPLCLTPSYTVKRYSGRTVTCMMHGDNSITSKRQTLFKTYLYNVDLLNIGRFL